MAKVKGESNEVLKVRPGAWQLHLGSVSPMSTPSVGRLRDQEQVAATAQLGHMQAAMPHVSAIPDVARGAASPDEHAGGDDAQLAWARGWRALQRSGPPRRPRRG